MSPASLGGSLLDIESIRQRRSRSACMKDVATLPPIVGSRLLAELEAEGIPAGSSDMAPGSLGAIPGLAMPSMTVWVEDEAHLEKAREILERLQKDAGDHTEYFEGDSAAEDA